MQVASMNVATPGWLLANTDQLFATNLGPRITASAKAYCPVFGGQNSTATALSLAMAGPDYQPGALRDSIRFFLRLHTLIVMASGGPDRTYARWVECGHAIVVYGYHTGRTKAPQPFLRPALWQVRGPI